MEKIKSNLIKILLILLMISIALNFRNAYLIHKIEYNVRRSDKLVRMSEYCLVESYKILFRSQANLKRSEELKVMNEELQIRLLDNEKMTRYFRFKAKDYVYMLKNNPDQFFNGENLGGS